MAFGARERGQSEVINNDEVDLARQRSCPTATKPSRTTLLHPARRLRGFESRWAFEPGHHVSAMVLNGFGIGCPDKVGAD